jgi:hypothetical protein
VQQAAALVLRGGDTFSIVRILQANRRKHHREGRANARFAVHLVRLERPGAGSPDLIRRIVNPASAFGDRVPVNTFLAISGAIGVVFGLEFLLLPEFALRQYGMQTESQALLQARYFGGTLVPWGFAGWLMRRVRDDAALKALLVAGAVGWAIGLALSYGAVSSGRQGPMGWLSVAIYGVFLLYSIFYLSSPARRG